MIEKVLIRLGIYAAIAAMVAAGAYAYRGSLIQRGYDQAISEVRIAENDRLRELIKEQARLVGVVKELHEQADKQKLDIAAFRERERVARQRLRDQEVDYQRRLAAASAEALRRYAQATDSHLDECRGMVEEFASEAAACATAAWTLKRYIDALP